METTSLSPLGGGILQSNKNRHTDMDWTWSVLIRYLIYQLINPSYASSASTNRTQPVNLSTRSCAPRSIRPRTTTMRVDIHTHMCTSSLSPSLKPPRAIGSYVFFDIDILIFNSTLPLSYRTVLLVCLWVCTAPSVSVRASVLGPPGVIRREKRFGVAGIRISLPYK